MDFWNKARSLAEEAAKRSQDLSFDTSRFSDIVAETTKRSKEIVSEASKRADQIRIEALKRADQFKHLAQGIRPPGGDVASPPAAESYEVGSTQEKELERFGITEELREFVKGITPCTFRDFPLEDDTQLYDVPAVSNVRKDLTEWQEKHANLVLSTVKEISKLRYELCPGVMKERKFWRIYFILMNSHISPYEKRYMGDTKLESSEKEDKKAIEQPEKEVKDRGEIKPPEAQLKIEKAIEQPEAGPTSVQENLEVKKESRISSAEQDIDEFLLGDMEDMDDDPDDGNGDIDIDLDKLVDSSDGEKGKS